MMHSTSKHEIRNTLAIDCDVFKFGQKQWDGIESHSLGSSLTV